MKLTCRLVRTWCALRDSSSPRHAATCPDCHAYFRAGTALDNALRSEAAGLRDAAPADFERDLLRAVHAARADEAADSSAASSHAGRLAWRPLAAATAVAAAIALGAVAFYRAPSPTSPLPTRDDAAALLASVETVSNQIAEDVIPKAGGLIADNPLQSEVTAVYADARAAVDFLALNFLPRSGLVASATPTP